MNKKNTVSGLIILSAMVPLAAESEIFNITVEDIDGNERTLESYKGKVMLIVNVASKCGFTYQYESLEAVHQDYKDKGLVIIGFPSNDFLGQEPGTDEEIKQFCTLNYGVTFPMFSKISVRGRKMHPLYHYLTSKETNPDFSGRITWNFNKFLVSRKGEIVDRFGSKDEPDSIGIINAVEKALATAAGGLNHEDSRPYPRLPRSQYVGFFHEYDPQKPSGSKIAWTLKFVLSLKSVSSMVLNILLVIPDCIFYHLLTKQATFFE